MRALTEWLNDAETVRHVESIPSINTMAKSVPTSEQKDPKARLAENDFYEMQKLVNRTGKKGRPREPSRFWRFVDKHDPERRSKVPVVAIDGYLEMLPTNIRNYANTHNSEIEKHFAGWCGEMAEAAEAGDAARTAECGYRALLELESLYDAYLLPYAEMTRARLKTTRKSARSKDPQRGIDSTDIEYMNSGKKGGKPNKRA